jgi:hypothetical protein
MKAQAWLRGAAVFTGLLAAGHMLGSPWTPASDTPGRAVVAAMSGYRFMALGVERNYFDFYQGFGWMLAAYLAGHAILFWQLSGLTADARRPLRSIVAVLCAEALSLTVLAWKYLFWVPLTLSAAILLCLAAAAWCLAAPRPAAAPTRAH